MIHALRKYWFLVGLSLVILVAGFFPGLSAPVRESGWLLPFLVAVILFVSGLTLETRSILRETRNVPALCLSLGATYLLCPLLAFALVRIWSPPGAGDGGVDTDFQEAVMIAAAQASTLASSIVLTRVARGQAELALVASLFSNALTALLTPTILYLSIGSVVRFPVFDMMARLALVILLPVCLGQLLGRFVKHRLSKTGIRALRVLPQLLVLFFAYVAIAAAIPHLTNEWTMALRFLGLTACLHVSTLVLIHVIAKALKLPRGQASAVLFCGSQKTVPNGIYLWSRFFAENPYGALPLVIHQILQLVLGTVIAEARRKGGDEIEGDLEGDLEGETPSSRGGRIAR